MTRFLALIVAAGLMAYAIATPPQPPPVEGSCVNETEPNDTWATANGLHALTSMCWTGSANTAAVDKDWCYAIPTRSPGEYTQEMRFTISHGSAVVYVLQGGGPTISFHPIYGCAGGSVDFSFDYKIPADPWQPNDNIYFWIETGSNPLCLPPATYTLEAL